jgi:hypothetical protein
MAFALRARCVVFASKARYSQGPAAARIGLRTVVGRIFGVPQRGTGY